MKMAFIGDVMLGRLVNDVLKDESFEYPWGDVLDVLSSADVRFCNLECVISDKGEPWDRTPKVFHFRSDSKNISVLKKAHINCVSLANNHVLDYGYEAFLEMLDTLDGAKIYYAGAGPSLDLAMRPAIFEIEGVRIGFLSLTDNETVWEAKATVSGTYYMPISLKDKRAETLMELVKRTKAEVDVLIVATHWGPNWGNLPEPNHVPFAHVLIENGANIIFGHSCHICQGVEIYKNCPIIYSAGDFIDDYAVDQEERNDWSFIFLVEVEDKKIKGLKLYPTIIKEFQAQHAKGEIGERVALRMRMLCEEMGTLVQWDRDLRCLEISID